jgi:hypothetical protein
LNNNNPKTTTRVSSKPGQVQSRRCCFRLTAALSPALN